MEYFYHIVITVPCPASNCVKMNNLIGYYNSQNLTKMDLLY